MRRWRSTDSYTVAEDGLLTVVAPGVLGNDDDVEGSPLTAAIVTGTAHGDVTLSANGSFTYDPDADYWGPTRSPTGSATVAPERPGDGVDHGDGRQRRAGG